MPITLGCARSTRKREVCQCIPRLSFSAAMKKGPSGPSLYSAVTAPSGGVRLGLRRHRRAIATARPRARHEVDRRARLAAGHDVVELLAADGFPFQQGLGDGLDLVAIGLDDL